MPLINKANYTYGLWVGLGVLSALFVFRIIEVKVLSKSGLGN